MLFRTYTKSNDLERLRITRKYLAFSTGKPGSDSKYEQFLEAIDPDTMDEWLREANGPVEDLSPNGPDDLVHDNQLEAAFFCRQIIRHLDESHGADGYGPSVLNVRTFWTEEKNPHDYLWRRCQRHHNWISQSMFRWCSKGNDGLLGDDPNPDAPHTICFLSDEAPLRDEKLSAAELSTVVWMSCTHYLYPEYKGHRIIPVTVISASGKCARIVQGIVEWTKCRTEIRVSDIISFESGGARGNWRQWLRLLGWAVAKPVGNTK